MEFEIGDIVKLKKSHPCGSNKWEIIRIGMDFKLKCCKCYRIIMITRRDFEESLKDEKDVHKRELLEQNGCLQNIKTSSIDQQKIALDNTVASIQFIDKPSSEIIMYAISKYPQKMKNYSKRPDGNFVKINNSKMKEHLVKRIFDDDESIREEIVKTEGRFVGYFTKPNEKIKRIAIENNSQAIEFIERPSVELIELAENGEPRLLAQYFVNEFGNMQKLSNKITDEFDSYLNKMPYEKIKKRIQNNPEQIKYVANQSFELQKIALMHDVDLIKYIKHIHPDIVEELYNNPNFDVYSLDDFSIQLYLVEAFKKIEKYRNSRQGEKKVSPKNNLQSVNEHMSEKGLSEIEVLAFYDSQEKELEVQNYVSALISSENDISTYLNVFAKRFDIINCKIASGFIYKSGLEMISTLLNTVYNNQGHVDIVVGSLKDYFKSSTDNKLINIDLETARFLNDMISEHGSSIFTLEDKFYHGKYYFLEGHRNSCCIIGSSNLTASGFVGNYELNMLYFMKNSSAQCNEFKKWFNDFLLQCHKIDNLSECNFTDTSMVFDKICDDTSIISIDIGTLENEVQSLTDDEVKFRLNLWLAKKPTNIYRKLNIDNLKDYVAFEYNKQKLIVFESFEARNGYYYFYGDNVFEIIQRLKNLTKTQIFQMSSMGKRGYHIKDQKNLKKNIYTLFK